MIYSRKEVFISSRTRHEMRIHYKIGYMKDGTLHALSMNGLMNAGAYGSHSLTVLSNAGSKVLPLFNKIEHVEFNGKTVYTNLPVGGAYRGYGATQGYFGLNVMLDMIARETKQDLLGLIKKQHIQEKETSFIFKALGEGKEGVEQFLRSCKLDECIDLGAKAIGWYEKRNKKIQKDPHTYRGVGLAVAMQGSGIPRVDMGAAAMKMNEDGSFNLYIGATDIGTGSDTIMAQIVAETLNTDVENIIVLSSDTDLTPFDVGAYASSTTYISGKAVEKCALKIKEHIFTAAADMLKTTIDNLILEKAKVYSKNTDKSVTFEEIGYYTFYTNNQFQIQASASNFAEESPPPFMAQFAEVEVNISTGHIRVIKMVSAADCGQPLNPKLVEGQIEGALINGISYALTEEYLFDGNGKMTNPDFGSYKIFTAADIPEIETIIVPSYEESGPYGAKSIAEIGINGPIPAIANAIYDAVGVRLYETPFTSEKIYNGLKTMDNRIN
jgi:CO/xanthine dehydrogenase Mo-binding subunit